MKKKMLPTTHNSDNLSNLVSDEARFFLEPSVPRQRQYEALRAYFVDKITPTDAAKKFGYTIGAFHVLCHKFRHDPQRDFFKETKPGPRFSPKKDGARDRVIELRKKNYSVADIHRLLKDEGIILSNVSIWKILDDEGFGRLPRRRDEEMPEWPKAELAAYADVRQFSLEPRVIETKTAGIFLLMRILADMNISTFPRVLKWYGSKMIPPEHALLSSLTLKLIGKERKSHVMDLCFDEGLAFSVGLPTLPKRSYIAEYSERITHEHNLKFMGLWLDELRKNNIVSGESFNLDFQSLPYFGEEGVIEKHYVSMRSRRQKSVLVFFAQDAKSKIFCYSNADLRKGEEADEIFNFIKYWKKKTGELPPHLVFDSKLTTHTNLSKIAKMNITFITLRRRSSSVLKDIANAPLSAWRKIELKKVDRKFRFPKVIDQEISLAGYEGKIRQIFIKDLGHEQPTILMTNDKKTSVSDLITRYALRMLIENSIANGVGFFHTTALSSSVAIRVDFDLLLTMIGQTSYHMLANKLRGYESCGAEVIFRKFIDTPGKIYIGDKEIEVRLNKRANNPILLHSGLINTPFSLPWIPNKKIRLTLR